jgi:pyruvate kinase
MTTTDAIGYATCGLAKSLSAKAMITATESGSTARKVAKYRPHADIIAVTSKKRILRKLLLVWGVTPILGRVVNNTDDMLQEAIQRSVDAGLVQDGDLVILTAGVPVGISGTTNLIKVEVVGKMLAQGTGLGNGSLVGFARKILEAADLETVGEQDILICHQTDSTYLDAMARARAIITETNGLTSHGAIVALNLNKPIIVGAEDILNNVQNGDLLTMELETGIIYKGQTGIQ